MNLPLQHTVIYKRRGETPLEAIQRWKAENPTYADMPASYAGRLDPMADGKLLVLLGDECKKQDTYVGLDKEYEIEVVLDLKTDTGDVLGLATYANVQSAPTAEAIRAVLRAERGSHERAYPAFSSKTVQGKPLFLYALEGTLHTISIPVHQETLYRISVVEQYALTKIKLESRITEALAVVPRSTEPSKELGADFRQDAVRARWTELFATLPHREFIVLHLRVVCASGSYMRTLAEHIGEALGTTGLALSITRTKIGTYVPIAGSLGFWSKQY